ncbi:MAG: NusG domain II-containing protein [Oscillospiraceae bacterium]|nr:NusG domain II-containing protein [Oscillospiraceae bacterium]
MEGGSRRIIKRADIIILIILLAGAAVYIAAMANRRESAVVCRVIYNRETAAMLSLDENRSFTFADLPVRFEVRDGRIAFVQSDCPDQICVDTGFIGTPGQSAACLPNGVILVVEGAGGVDAVV